MEGQKSVSLQSENCKWLGFQDTHRRRETLVVWGFFSNLSLKRPTFAWLKCGNRLCYAHPGILMLWQLGWFRRDSLPSRGLCRPGFFSQICHCSLLDDWSRLGWWNFLRATPLLHGCTTACPRKVGGKPCLNSFKTIKRAQPLEKEKEQLTITSLQELF